jgi:peptidoglycan biosynthesis protein MviN/MurJ (putative lipid II flippase)
MGSLFLKLTVASAVLAAVCWTGEHYLLAGWPTMRFWPKLGSLVLVIAAAGGAFFWCANALAISEMREITAALWRRLGRA